LKRISLALLLILGFLPTAHAATLLGFWDFEELSGTTVLDQSGNGNNGTIGTAQRTAGQVGRGLFFDGSGGVSIPNSPSLDSLPGGFTLSAWINPTEFPDYTTIFWKTDRHFREHMLHFQVNGRLYGCMNGPAAVDGPCDFEGIAPNTIGLNEWHFVAWTYDEPVHRFYDNGVEVYSAVFTDPWAGNDIDLLIGYHLEVPSADFRGYIDEARIYSGALTPEELLRDQNGERVIPELSSFLMMGLGLLGAPFINRRRPAANKSLTVPGTKGTG